jgi:tetratricopeptide (TPR) repeat protein
MLFFLKVVAAVVLAICLLLAIGFWMVKRWFRKLSATGMAAARLIDPRWMRPARLRLTPAAGLEPTESFNVLWRDLHAQGFRKLGDFLDADQALAVRAAWREAGSIGAALVESRGEETSFTLFAVDRQRGFVALSNERGTELRLPRLHWQFDEGLAVDTAVRQFVEQVQGHELLRLDVRGFRLAWEQAHATRADYELQFRPRRLAVEQAGAKQNPPASNEQVEQAYRIVISHWQGELQAALLDHYRRSSRIDAVAWEEIRDNLHVVHDQLEEQDIEAMLVDDEAGKHVLKQCVAQGLQGIALYEQVLQRLDAGRQRERIGEVGDPVRAVIYVRRDAPEAPAGSGRFLYEAVGPDDRATSGALIATSSADALQQAAKMGLREVRIVLEPNPVDATIDLLDPESAAIAVRATREGILVAVLRALRSNAWIWAPPLAWLAWLLWRGEPFDWVGWVAVLYAGAAAAALVFLIGPLVLYNQVLRARATARWNVAAICLALVKRLSVFGGITRNQLLLEKAKILAGQGQLERALELWQGLQSALPEAEYHSGRSQVFDTAGEHERMIEAQRAAIVDSPLKDMATVDLALSLARWGNAQEAESMLARVKQRDLSEMAQAGYQIARGILLAREGRHDVALRQYAQAIGQLEGYRGNPLILALIAEINAYAAISFKRLGQADRAAQLWQHVWPLLKVHRGTDRLEREYEAA